MTDQYPIQAASTDEIAEFIKRYGRPYDKETDAYDRAPFIADIREGKTASIYKTHSYHTKVPPRAIIPYILHYTDPGDIVLDPFCGSGMTGVACWMCDEPPRDILNAASAAEPGARHAILNDLAPAACHISFNYCTPVDADVLSAHLAALKCKITKDLNRLYYTEHYEPAVGQYAVTNSEVAIRLKNPPLGKKAQDTLLIATDDADQSWELLDRVEVERRMGPDALLRHPLAEGASQFVSIPATVQYTIWSDVYRCQGSVTTTQPTGRINKKTGKPIVAKTRRARGCGTDAVLWDYAVDHQAGKINDTFTCPSCKLTWKKTQATRVDTVPVSTNYKVNLLDTKNGTKTSRFTRRLTASEATRIEEVTRTETPYPAPSTELDLKGPQFRRNALSARGFTKVTDFYTRRNLWALAGLWHYISGVSDKRIRSAMQFVFTAIAFRVSRRRILYSTGEGKGWASTIIGGGLYIPSLTVESNVWTTFEKKIKSALDAFRSVSKRSSAVISCQHAGRLGGIPDNSVDYVFADPPFGSNIYYAEMNRIWEAWLGSMTDEPLEAVVHRKQDGGRKKIEDYQRLITEAFGEIYRVLKPGRWATVEFNNSDGRVFEVVKDAVRGAGFRIENMLFLDKVQKTFKQVKGNKGEEDVVGHDVIFNLKKPVGAEASSETRDDGNGELERLVVDHVRGHLRELPFQIQKDGRTYSDEHRTTPFLNTMLMNALIPKGENVERLNLPFIDAICSRYFRKIDNRWYLRDEQVGDYAKNDATMLTPTGSEVVIRDETAAIEWLRQRLISTPMRIGDLRPHWMRATVHLTSDISTRLEKYLLENFWLDRKTRKWREPSDDERQRMDNAERQQARHDAERFLHGLLRRPPSDTEVLDWIGHVYDSATLIEEEAVGLTDNGELEDVPAESLRLYEMMPRLLQGVLKENVDAQQYALAQRQCRIAGTKVIAQTERDREKEQSGPANGQLSLFSQTNDDE